MSSNIEINLSSVFVFSSYQLFIKMKLKMWLHNNFKDICSSLAEVTVTWIEKWLVMCQTSFYRTSNQLEHNFSNIERTLTCSSVGDGTRTPYFWLRTIEHRTSNLIQSSLHLLNCSSNWLKRHFFEHRTNLNVFILW